MIEKIKNDKLKFATIVVSVIVFVVGIVMTAMNTGDTYAVTYTDTGTDYKSATVVTNDCPLGFWKTVGTSADAPNGPLVDRSGNKYCVITEVSKFSSSFAMYVDLDTEEKCTTYLSEKGWTYYGFEESGLGNMCAYYSAPMVTATFDTSGGPTVPSITGALGMSYKMPGAPSRPGYIFNYWYEFTDGTSIKYSPGQNMKLSNTTYKVNWSPIQYNVVYNANGGIGTMESSAHTYDVAKELTANAFTRSGYEFKGWGLSPDGGVVYSDKASVKNLTTVYLRDVNLYALWDEIEVSDTTVKPDTSSMSTWYIKDVGYAYCYAEADVSSKLKATYTSDGGCQAIRIYSTNSSEWSYGVTDSCFIKTSNLSSSKPSSCSSAGGGGSTTPDTKEYTVTYNGNGGKYNGSEIWVDPNKVSVGEKYLTFSNNNFFVRTGFNFNGWNEKADGTGTSWNNYIGKEWTWTSDYSRDVTLYAQWTANTYKVVYNANGGTGTMADSSHTYGTAKSLTANTFVREGYTFAGWAIKDNGSVKYKDKESVNNLTATNGGKVTLYAIWSPVSSDGKEKYTIIYDANGGKDAPANQTKTEGTDLKLSTSKPTREGYTFLGWADSSSATKAKYSAGSMYKTDADIKLYAVWEVNSKADDEISENNKTGDALIYIAWAVGIGALGYSVYYFMRRKNNI